MYFGKTTPFVDNLFTHKHSRVYRNSINFEFSSAIPNKVQGVCLLLNDSKALFIDKTIIIWRRLSI